MALNKDIFSDAFEELEENIDKNIEKTKKAQDRVSFEFTEDDLIEPTLTPQEKEKSLAENNKKADENLSAGVNELGESVVEQVREMVKHEAFDPNVSDKGEALRNALFGDEENIKNCFNIINPKTKGFRAFFVGNEGGYKKLAIENLSKLLVSMKKISSEEPIYLAFNELEKYENDSFLNDRFYIINDLGDAIVNLFNSDVSQQSNAAQARYKRIMDKLLRLPANLYLVLDCDEPDYRGFLMLDARVRYRFSKKCVFQDYDDAKVATDFLKATGAGYSLEDIIEFLYNNKKYFPFKNDELVEFLVSTFYETGSLPEDRYKPFALEEAFKNIIGMDDIKNQVRDLESFLKARKRFDEAGIKQPELRLGMLFTGSSGTGKGLPNRSLVITDTGYKKVSDIKLGDSLFDINGEKVEVVGVFPQGEKDIYKIYFDDGTDIYCDDEHLWLVQDYLDRSKNNKKLPRKESYAIFTAPQMLSLGVILKKPRGSFRYNFSIPINKAVSFSEKKLPMDPYLFGIFISNLKSFSDKELSVDFLNSLENRIPNSKSFNKSDLAFIKKALFPLEVFFTNDSLFSFSSIQQREKIASAILDSMAYVYSNDRFIIRIKYAHDFGSHKYIANIFRSLGAKVSVTNQKHFINIFIKFPFDVSRLLFSDKLKKHYIFTEKSVSTSKFITNIEKVGTEKTTCFKVYNQNVREYNSDVVLPHYKLSFESGEELVLSSEDYIYLQDEINRKSFYKSDKDTVKRPTNETCFKVKELLDFPLSFSGRRKNFSKSLIIRESNFSYKDINGLIHPYILGVLLGDGSMSPSPAIYSDLKDVEIQDKVETLLEETGFTLSRKIERGNFIKSLIVNKDNKSHQKQSFGRRFLEPLGLLNVICYDKFIPEIYFSLCSSDRFELLKGLMDTDGTVGRTMANYSTSSFQLANDVRRLVESLGGIASITAYEPSTVKLPSGKFTISKKYYILHIRFPSDYATNTDGDSNIFYLKRKAKKYSPKRSRDNFRNFLVSIEPLGDLPLDHDIDSPQTETYLANDYIVTHNTTMARIVAHLLFELGYIKEDKLIETDTQDFVQGEFTSQKTNKMLRQALGGVLFIDEAYNFGNLGERGMESIAIIVKFMEDYKDDLVVMFAGYQKEINQLLLPLNSGLISRIAYKFNIADYTEEELTAMYRLKLGLLGLQLDDSPKVKKAMEGPLSYAARSAKFSGNGRFISNMVQATMVSHAKYMEQHPDADIHIITAESIPPIEQIMKVMR